MSDSSAMARRKLGCLTTEDGSGASAYFLKQLPQASSSTCSSLCVPAIKQPCVNEATNQIELALSCFGTANIDHVAAKGDGSGNLPSGCAPNDTADHVSISVINTCNSGDNSNNRGMGNGCGSQGRSQKVSYGKSKKLRGSQKGFMMGKNRLKKSKTGLGSHPSRVGNHLPFPWTGSPFGGSGRIGDSNTMILSVLLAISFQAILGCAQLAASAHKDSLKFLVLGICMSSAGCFCGCVFVILVEIMLFFGYHLFPQATLQKVKKINLIATFTFVVIAMIMACAYILVTIV